MKWTQPMIVLAGAVLAACDVPGAPADPTWLRASVGPAENGYHGTAWVENGARRPAAPPHFILHSTDQRNGSQIQIWRNVADIPEGTFDIAADGSFQLAYMEPDGKVTRRYVATGGSVWFERHADGALTGSFEAVAELRSECTSGPGSFDCSPVQDVGAPLPLNGTFRARNTTGRPW
jgi:hypothetical protein